MKDTELRKAKKSFGGNPESQFSGQGVGGWGSGDVLCLAAVVMHG